MNKWMKYGMKIDTQIRLSWWSYIGRYKTKKLSTT